MRYSLALAALFLAVVPVLGQDSADRSDRLTGAQQVLGGPFTHTVLYTNIPGDPSAAVPGLPGVSFDPGTGTTHFDRVFGSPNGNWALTALTDLATTADEVMIVNNVVEAHEGDPATWAPGESIGLLDTKVGVNDSGDFVFATNTDGPTTSDEYMLLGSGGGITIAAQEASAAPALAGAFWGSTIESGVILADGTVGLVSDSITGAGVTTADDEILVRGATLLSREGITVPAGQLGSEAWENFDVDDIFMSADGVHWLAQGDLSGSTTTDDVVVVDGTVVIQEGVILAGSGFANPVDGSGIVGVHMTAGGQWFARGNNDTSELDWVYGSGGVVTSGGSPITGGAAELFDDTDFSDLFFLHVGNSNGDFIIGGVTSAASTANGVLVLNNDTVVVRESDPIDLDGNGMFDDDAFFDTFGNDDGHLTDAGIFYFVATIKDGTDTRIGQGFFSTDLTGIIPVELMEFGID
jgi:hypothetical protein